jgi:hypothetical protein
MSGAAQGMTGWQDCWQIACFRALECNLSAVCTQSSSTGLARCARTRWERL